MKLTISYSSICLSNSTNVTLQHCLMSLPYLVKQLVVGRTGCLVWMTL